MAELGGHPFQAFIAKCRLVVKNGKIQGRKELI